MDLVGYVVRFGSDFGQILVRFLDKIGQIVSPIFLEFWSDLEIIYTAFSSLCRCLCSSPKIVK